MEPSTILAFIAVGLVEPVLVLVLAPRITTRRVSNDVDRILTERVEPTIREAVAEAVEGTVPVIRDAVADAIEDAQAGQRGRALSASGVAAREKKALGEETLRAAVAQRFGPAGVAMLEVARGDFPVHYKAACQALASSPESAPQVLDRLASLVPGLGGQKAQQVMYL